MFTRSLPQPFAFLFRWTQVCEDLVWPWGCYAQFPVCCSESAAGKRPAGHEELHAEAACPSEQPVQRHTAMQQQPCWGISQIIRIAIRLKASLLNQKHSEVLQCCTYAYSSGNVRFPRNCIVFFIFFKLKMHKHHLARLVNCHTCPFPLAVFTSP